MPKRLNPFATHLPVLEAILKAAPIKTVVEFGPGHYSTALFAKAGCRVQAIEQQNIAWYERLSKQYEDDPAISLVYLPPPGAGAKFLSELPGTVDLILVDGGVHNRALDLAAAFRKTSIVVAHDTEDKRYGLDDVAVPRRWKTHVFSKLVPWSTVWSTQKKVVEAVKKVKEG